MRFDDINNKFKLYGSLCLFFFKAASFMSSLGKGVKNTSKRSITFPQQNFSSRLSWKRQWRANLWIQSFNIYAFVKALITLLSISVKNKLNDWMKMFIWGQELSQKRCRSSAVIAAVDSCIIRDKCIKKENHIHKVMWLHVFCDHALSIWLAKQSKYSFHVLHSISLSLSHI